MKCPYCGVEVATVERESIEGCSRAQQVSQRLAGKDGREETLTCPACGRRGHVRRNPATGATYLLSEKDARGLDSMRLANLYLHVCDDPFERFCERAASGGRGVSQRVWEVLDRRRRAAVKKGDWNVASKLALEKARYLCGVGRPFFEMRREAMRYQLLDLKARGAERVRIVSGHDGMVCPRCAALSGRVLTIEEALEEMPLPVHCDNAGRKVHIADDRGWCRCFYVRQA